MKNRILSAALALCLCLGLAVPALAAGPTFTDVPASHWAYDAIEDMSSRGVVAGFGNGQIWTGRQCDHSPVLGHACPSVL